MPRYDSIIIDVNNIAHRTFNHKEEKALSISKKLVYKNAVVNFINKVDELVSTYLHSDGQVYLLFDNPTSRIDMQSAFYFADRKDVYAKYKSNRKKEPKEFYNSINLLKFYYMVGPANYHTIQISNLEADDLVKSTLTLYCQAGKSLLVSNDLDWAANVSADVDWLNKWDNPETTLTLSESFGFSWSNKALILYKAIFGDEADVIPKVAPASMKSYFSALESITEKEEDVLSLANSDENVEKFPLLKYIRENHKQFSINLQLVRSIPVHDDHVKAVTTTGRNSQVTYDAVRKAINIGATGKKFSFGNIKRPRE